MNKNEQLTQSDPEQMAGTTSEKNESADMAPEGAETPSREALLERCGDLAASNNILDQVAADVRASGFAGETSSVLATFLAVVSRLLDRPVSMAVRGPSSAGKSYTIKAALKFHPPEAYFEMTAMSPKALAYIDENLSHRMIVIYEGAGISGEFTSYAVRSLLSEGNLKYLYTDFEGGRKARWQIIDGPTGLLTSTAGTIDPELATRLLSVNIADNAELTSEIVHAQARLAAGDGPLIDYERYHDLLRLIALDAPQVVVPYATRLAEGVNFDAVRIRRDFPSVIGLVRAHALLHRETRTQDDRNRLLASPADYEAVHRLIATMVAEGAEQAVSPEVRQTVKAVQKLYYTRGAADEPVTIGDLRTKLGLTRTAINRRVNRALGLGYLSDLSGGSRGKKKLLTPGDPMPEDAGVLPDPSVLG